METTTTAKDKNKANGTTPETAVLVAEQTGTAIAKADSNVQRFKTVDLDTRDAWRIKERGILPHR